MKKVYILTYIAYGSNDYCMSCNYFETKERARAVRSQYQACGHKNVKIVELLHE